MSQDQNTSLQTSGLGGGLAPAPGSPAAPPAPGRAEEPLFRLELLRSLQLHKKLALAVFLFFAALSAAYLFTQWTVYTSEALLYVQPTNTDLMDRSGARNWPFDNNTYESFISQQVISITRNDVLLNAVRKIGPEWRKPGESDQEAAERLEHGVQVKRMGTSYQISITARSTDAETAAKLANAVATSYIEKASRDGKLGDDQRLATLREEKDRVEKAMAEDRAEQEALNKKLGAAVAGSPNSGPYGQQLMSLQQELVRARAAHDEAAARLTSANANQGSANALGAQAEEMVAADAGLVSMKTELYKKRAEAMAKMSNLTPNHPQYKQAAAELAQIDESIDNMTRTMRSKASQQIELKLRADLNRTAIAERGVNAQLAQLAGTAVGSAPLLQRSNDLGADLLRLRTRQASLDDQIHNLLVEAHAPGASHVAAAAVAPLHPDIANILRKGVILAFACLLLPLLAAVAANKLDQKIYIASDVHRVLGFEPMAVLPDFQQVSSSVADEHILRLSASIEYLRQEGRLRNCILTGSGSGAGVSTIVTRVRSMLDSLGRATVLMDASGTPPPPEPTVHKPGGADSQAAAAGSRSTALLQRMANEAETQEEALVLTDTSPLAHSAETQYLARFVDAAIIVLESGVTTRKELRDVASVAQRLDIAAVGFVLNRVRREKGDAAFRSSLRAVEERLKTQSRVAARPPASAEPRPPVEPPEGQRSQVAGKGEASALRAASSSRSLFGLSEDAFERVFPSQSTPESVASAPRAARPAPEQSQAGAPAASAAPVESAAPAASTPPPPPAFAAGASPVSREPEPARVSSAAPEAANIPAAPKPTLSSTLRAVQLVKSASAQNPAGPEAPAAVPAEASAPPASAAAQEPVAPRTEVESAPEQQAQAETPRPLAYPTPITKGSPRPPVTDRLAPFKAAGSQPVVPFGPHEGAAMTPDALEAAIHPEAAKAAKAAKTQRTATWAQSWKRFAPALPAPAAPKPAESAAPPEPPADLAPASSYAYGRPEMERHLPPSPAPSFWQENLKPSMQEMAAASAPPAPPAPPAVSEQEQVAQFDAAARMAGMRNLIFSLGMKNAQRTPEPPEENVAREAAFRYADLRPEETPAAPQPPARAFFDEQRASHTPAAVNPPELVTAAPEILPPNPEADQDSGDPSRLRGAAARRTRRENFDDIDTLPSKRGQYRKS